MVVSTLNRNWKSFALAIVGAEYVLRWLPRGTHQWDKFVTPEELAGHLANNKLAITEQAGVVYSPFADKWSLSSDMDVNYMVVAEGMYQRGRLPLTRTFLVACDVAISTACRTANGFPACSIRNPSARRRPTLQIVSGLCQIGLIGDDVREFTDTAIPPERWTAAMA